MTPSLIDENIHIILKAAQWDLRIDETDFENQFDYTKKDHQGNTIFHHMCINKDVEILNRYPDLLPEYAKVQNNIGKDLEMLALQNNFVEWFEFIYKDFSSEKLYDQNGHILAQGINRDLTKVLKDLIEIEVSIREAIQGIDFNKKADEKGDTFFQKVVKKFIRENQGQLLTPQHTQLFTTLLNEGEVDINKTFRDDKNTVLHLVARSGNLDLLNLILDGSSVKLKAVRNRFQQTCKDLAEIYGHKEFGKAIKDRFLEQQNSNSHFKNFTFLD